jgi:hypothetical protein
MNTILYADYTGRIDPVELLLDGYRGVCRYLSWLPNSKVIQSAEYNTLINAGIDVICNWEYAATDWMNGSAYGTIQANEAVRQLRQLGYPKDSQPVPGSCDFNMSRQQWLSGGKAYAMAYAGTLRNAGYMPGVYGPHNVIQWCMDEVPDMKWFWRAGRSTAWDNNKTSPDGTHLLQFAASTVGGVEVDMNNVLLDWTRKMSSPLTPDQATTLTVIDRRIRQALLMGESPVNDVPGQGANQHVWIVDVLNHIVDSLEVPAIDYDKLSDMVVTKLVDRLANARVVVQ